VAATPQHRFRSAVVLDSESAACKLPPLRYGICRRRHPKQRSPRRGGLRGWLVLRDCFPGTRTRFLRSELRRTHSDRVGSGLFPKVGAILIVSVGVDILADILAASMKGQRDVVLVATSLTISATATFMPPQVLELITRSQRIVLGDGVETGTITAFVLNLVMRRLHWTFTSPFPSAR
jgi:hypothetical protein